MCKGRVMPYKDPEKRQAYFRAWYVKNRAWKNRKSAEWAQAHPEAQRESHLKSYKRAREKEAKEEK